MTRFRITDLRDKEARGDRPAGYADAVIAAGERDHDWVLLSFERAAELRRKYCAPVGLGDVVEWFCLKTGLKRLARRWERMTGRKCGCERRRATLNRWTAPVTRSLRAAIASVTRRRS